MKNGTIMQYFHWYIKSDDNLWKKVKQDVDELSEIGITAMWLPPGYKGTSGKNDVGYGVYDKYDLGEFDQKGSIRTKYGTKVEYLDAIKAAHNSGIQVYADIVLNHLAGADRTEWVKAIRVKNENHNFTIGEEVWIEAFTEFNFSGRNGKYSKFRWNHEHFSGVDWAHNLSESCIFKFIDLNRDWAEMVSNENGNYDYLMFSDLDMNNSEVRTELARWGKWYVNETNVDGFRFDAVKHIQFSFFRNWLDYLRKETTHELFAVGEYWDSNVKNLLKFIGHTHGKMSLFDAPLQSNFYHASRTNYDMRTILDNTLVKDQPSLAVTLVENHDTQPLQALEASVDYWFKPLAYAIILLRKEGYPCVFYPDYYGAEYTDKGRDGGEYKITLAPVEKLKELLKLRKTFSYGIQHDYFDDKNIVGWTREGDDGSLSGLASILSNDSEGSKWMEVGMKHANKKFYDYLGNRDEKVIIDNYGWGNFHTNARSVSVWVPSN
jgi:alpha-amylase